MAKPLAPRIQALERAIATSQRRLDKAAAAITVATDALKAAHTTMDEATSKHDACVKDHAQKIELLAAAKAEQESANAAMEVEAPVPAIATADQLAATIKHMAESQMLMDASFGQMLIQTLAKCKWATSDESPIPGGGAPTTAAASSDAAGSSSVTPTQLAAAPLPALHAKPALSEQAIVRTPPFKAPPPTPINSQSLSAITPPPSKSMAPAGPTPPKTVPTTPPPPHTPRGPGAMSSVSPLSPRRVCFSDVNDEPMAAKAIEDVATGSAARKVNSQLSHVVADLNAATSGVESQDAHDGAPAAKKQILAHVPGSTQVIHLDTPQQDLNVQLRDAIAHITSADPTVIANFIAQMGETEIQRAIQSPQRLAVLCENAAESINPLAASSSGHRGPLSPVDGFDTAAAEDKDGKQSLANREKWGEKLLAYLDPLYPALAPKLVGMMLEMPTAQLEEICADQAKLNKQVLTECILLEGEDADFDDIQEPFP